MNRAFGVGGVRAEFERDGNDGGASRPYAAEALDGPALGRRGRRALARPVRAASPEPRDGHGNPLHDPPLPLDNPEVDAESTRANAPGQRAPAIPDCDDNRPTTNSDRLEASAAEATATSTERMVRSRSGRTPTTTWRSCDARRLGVAQRRQRRRRVAKPSQDRRAATPSPAMQPSTARGRSATKSALRPLGIEQLLRQGARAVPRNSGPRHSYGWFPRAPDGFPLERPVRPRQTTATSSSTSCLAARARSRRSPAYNDRRQVLRSARRHRRSTRFLAPLICSGREPVTAAFRAPTCDEGLYVRLGNGRLSVRATSTATVTVVSGGSVRRQRVHRSRTSTRSTRSFSSQRSSAPRTRTNGQSVAQDRREHVRVPRNHRLAERAGTSCPGQSNSWTCPVMGDRVTISTARTALHQHRGLRGGPSPRSSRRSTRASTTPTTSSATRSRSGTLDPRQGHRLERVGLGR